MDNKKRFAMLEQCAYQLNTLAICLTVEAARKGGVSGRGLAIIAEETRHLTQKLALTSADFNNKELNDKQYDMLFKATSDIAFQTGLLVINFWLELVRAYDGAEERSYVRVMSVYIEEIRALAAQILNISGKKSSPQSFVIRETASPLKSTEKPDFFLQYSISGVSFIENMSYIKEINYPDKNAFANGIYNLRGLEMPVINCYKKLNLTETDSERQMMMIICLNDNNTYAVAIDDLDISAPFQSKIGYNVPPAANHAFADYTRECWDAVGGDQFIFIDWEKFI